MTRSKDIPVSGITTPAQSSTQRADADEPETVGGGLVAILHEIVHLLETLAQTGESSAIDLRSLPMAPGEYEQLRKVLGQGEVAITLDLGSPSYIRETGFHGVWWIQHCTPDEEIASEYIEIAAVPEILSADPHDMGKDAQRLKRQIAQMKA